MSTQTGSISFEATGGFNSYAKQNYATLSQIKGQFATCGTGAATAAKVATIVPADSGWTLYDGATITVKFTSENTTTAPTLNVNGTGAKPIKDFNGNDLTKVAYEWPEGAAMSFTYDGSSWRLQDSDLMERVHSAETSIEQNATNIALKANSSDVYNKAGVDSLIAQEVSDRNAAIELSANGITQSVSSTYATKTDFNNLEIGGTNLALESKNPNSSHSYVNRKTCWYNSPSVFNRDDGFTELRCGSNFDGICVCPSSLNPSVGDEFVLSVNARNDSSIGMRIIFYCMALNSSNTRVFGHFLKIETRYVTVEGDSASIYHSNSLFPSGKEERLIVKLTWLQAAQDLLDNGGSLLFSIQAVSSDWTKGNLAFWKLKLEKGNKPTDWTPAPEDLEAYTDTQVSSAKSEIKQTTDNITSTVEKINSAKYVTTSYSYTLAGIKTYAADGYSGTWTTSSDDTIRVGDIVYVKVQDTTRTCPVYIKVKVTKVNSATSITGISHGYEDVLPVDTIKSTINQSSDTVKIQAKHIEIDGTATFKNSNNTTTTLGNYLSNNYDSKGSAAAVQTNLDNLKIGGVNLLKRLDWLSAKNQVQNLAMSNCTAQYVKDATTPSGYLIRFTLTNAENNAHVYLTNMKSRGGMVHGETYIASLWIRANKNTEITPNSYVECASNYWRDRNVIITTQWEHCYTRFIYDETKQYQAFYLVYPQKWIGLSNGDYIDVYGIKLERGTKATDWSPAPEDAEYSVNELYNYATSTRSWYATCSTAAGTVDKVAIIDPVTSDFTTSILKPGTVVFVKFTTTNSGAVANLTLNVNNTGAKPIKQIRNGTIQTIPGVGYIAANSTYQFTYDGTNWLYTGNYDSNTNDNARYVQFYNTIVAGEALHAASIIGGRTDGKFYQIKENSSFDLSSPLLWLTADLASGATDYSHIYTQCYDRTLATYYTSFTNTTANKIVFLVGTVNGNTFNVYGANSNSYLTVTIPTTENGLFYIPIGRLGNQSNGKNYFNYQVGVPITLYAYVDGKFRQVTPTEIVATQKIYYRSKVSGNVPTPKTWITSKLNIFNDTISVGVSGWSTKVTPLSKDKNTNTDANKYLYLYTCEQRKRLDGTIECVPTDNALLDDSTTVIDGGNIITGTVTANQLNASHINASKILEVGSLTDAAAKTVLNSEIEVGGTNLLRLTGTPLTAYVNTTSYSTYHMYSTDGNNSTTSPMLSAFGLVSGDEITLSFDWTTAANGSNALTYGNFRIEFYGKKTDGSSDNGCLAAYDKAPLVTMSSSNNSGHYIGTVKLTSTTINARRLVLRVDASVLALTIKNLKLEKGNVATDWSEAFGDVAGIKHVTSSYTNPLATIKSWAEEGKDAGNWAVESTAGVNVGDTVYIKTLPSDNNANPVYVIVTVTSINSATVLRGISHGYLDTAGTVRQEIITTASDFNNYKTTGVYYFRVGSNTNAPVTNHGKLTVNFDLGTPNQIFEPDNLSYYYKRTYSSSTWSEWSKIDAIGANTLAATANNKASAWYGTSGSAWTEAAKTASVVGFTSSHLVAGTTIMLRTSGSNNVANALTLNVQSTGAKPIYVGGQATSATNQLLWHAGAILTFTYTGSAWEFADPPNTIMATRITDTAGTANKLVYSTQTIIRKGTILSTAFAENNTAASPALGVAVNANGDTNFGWKPIYYGTSTSNRPTAENGMSWIPNTEVLFTFDGANWRMGGKTYIDGGHILTESISADKIKVSSINIGDLSGAIGGKNLALDSDQPYNWQKYTPTTYELAQVKMTEDFIPGETYTVTIWGGPITRSDKSNCWYALYWGGGNFSLANATLVETGIYKATFTISTTSTAQHTAAGIGVLSIYNTPAVGASGTTYSAPITKIQIEKGNVGTEWEPAQEELPRPNLYKPSTEMRYIGSGAATLSAYDDSYHGRTLTITTAGGTLRMSHIIPKTNVPYTVSFILDASVATTITVDIMDNTTQAIKVPKGISKVIFTSTPTRALDSTYHFVDMVFANAGTYKMEDIKVEPGTVPTAWISAEQISNYIYGDSSGIRIASANPSTQKQRIQLTNSRIDFYNASDVSIGAITGDAARFGPASAAHINIDGSAGITLYDTANKERTVVDGTGLHIFGSDGSTKIASFGTTVKLGQSSNSHINLDYHSLQLVDKENNIYFYISDLRDSTGYATLTESFIGDGTTKDFFVSLRARSTATTTATVDGTSVTVSSISEASEGRSLVTLASAPGTNKEIKITYQTDRGEAKAYTLGIRKESESIGPFSYAEGVMVTASGNYSHAEGYNTIASSYCSHAEGSTTTASGQYSHVEGRLSIASGFSSHAEGDGTKAKGYYSHAEGSANTASEDCSHVEGRLNTASGYCSHAEGESTKASGRGSHTGGLGSTANENYMTAIGKYNKTVTSALFVVGNGTSDTSRADALVLNSTGALTIGGDLTFGNGTTATLIAKTPSRTAGVLWVGGSKKAAGDANGTVVRLQGGGLMLVGGGEYPTNRYNVADLNDGTEDLYLGADGTVYVETNGDTIANRKTFTFGTDGTFNSPSTIKQNGTAVSLSGHTHSYLPLSGGTMSGGISMVGNRIYWKESGYGDQFAIIPAFSGADDANLLKIQSAVGAADTTPAMTDKVTISGKTGNVNITTGGLSVKGSITQNGTTVSLSGHTHNSIVRVASRPTSPNNYHHNSNGVYTFLATSSMTTDKPPADAHILHFNWDNGTATTGTWDAQLALSTSNGKIFRRGQNNGTWTDWYTVYDTGNKPTLSELGAAASSHNHSASNITSGTFDAARIPNLNTSKLTAGTLPVARGGTGKTAGICYMATSLYENTSGKFSGAIPLSETAANFTFIEIYCKDNDGRYCYTKVWSPNGKTVNVTQTLSYGGNFYIKSKAYTISGTGMDTASTSGTYHTGEVNAAGSNSGSSSDILGVVKVIGYK